MRAAVLAIADSPKGASTLTLERLGYRITTLRAMRKRGLLTVRRHKARGADFWALTDTGKRLAGVQKPAS